MKEIIIAITGWLNMLLFSIVTIPQILKTIKTRTVTGVSITVYYILMIANIDAFVYAYLIKQMPLMAKYGFGFLISLIYTIVYFLYKNENTNHI